MPQRNRQTVKTLVCMPKPQREELDHIAAIECRPLSEVIREGVRMYIERFKTKNNVSDVFSVEPHEFKN